MYARMFSGKRHCFAALIAGCLASNVCAELLYCDPFLIGSSPLLGEYTPGPLVGQNPLIGPTPFFTGPWQGRIDAGGATVQSPGLNYFSAPVTGGSVIANPSSRTWRTLSNPWDATTDGTFYLSYLMNFGGVGLTDSTINDVGHRVVEMWSSGGPAGNDAALVARIGYMSYDGNFNNLPPSQAPLKFGLGHGTEQIIPGGPASFLDDIGVTHMFVLKFILSDQAASDTVQLFLDPTDDEKPTLPNVEFVNVDFTLGAMSGPVQFAGTGTGATFDEIRVGTEYEDVLSPLPSELGPCSDLEEQCYLAIVENMNQFGNGFVHGDLNNDGRIDLYDLRIWRDNRTDITGFPQIASVPETTSLVVMLCSLVVPVCSRRGIRRI